MDTSSVPGALQTPHKPSCTSDALRRWSAAALIPAALVCAWLAVSLVLRHHRLEYRAAAVQMRGGGALPYLELDNVTLWQRTPRLSPTDFASTDLGRRGQLVSPSIMCWHRDNKYDRREFGVPADKFQTCLVQDLCGSTLPDGTAGLTFPSPKKLIKSKDMVTVSSWDQDAVHIWARPENQTVAWPVVDLLHIMNRFETSNFYHTIHDERSSFFAALHQSGLVQNWEIRQHSKIMARSTHTQPTPFDELWEFMNVTIVERWPPKPFCAKTAWVSDAGLFYVAPDLRGFVAKPDWDRRPDVSRQLFGRYMVSRVLPTVLGLPPFNRGDLLFSGMLHLEQEQYWTHPRLHGLLQKQSLGGLSVGSSGSVLAFMGRRNSQHRGVVNYDAMLEMLEEKFVSRGYPVLVMDNMTDVPLFEQIAMMSRVTLVFGTHGAGLTHCYWMQPHSSIIELRPKAQRREWFTEIAADLDLLYWHYLSSDPDEAMDWQTKIKVQLDVLEAVIKLALWTSDTTFGAPRWAQALTIEEATQAAANTGGYRNFPK